MGQRLARIGAYIKAHWKELLALVLAAIPALFLVFHKGTQQAAQNAVSGIPDAFGLAGGSANGNTTPASTSPDQTTVASTGSASDPVSQAAQAVKQAVAPKQRASVNGANSTVAQVPPKGTTKPKPKPTPPTPGPLVGALTGRGAGGAGLAAAAHRAAAQVASTKKPVTGSGVKKAAPPTPAPSYQRPRTGAF